MWPLGPCQQAWVPPLDGQVNRGPRGLGGERSGLQPSWPCSGLRAAGVALGCFTGGCCGPRQLPSALSAGRPAAESPTLCPEHVSPSLLAGCEGDRVRPPPAPGLSIGGLCPVLWAPSAFHLRGRKLRFCQKKLRGQPRAPPLRAATGFTWPPPAQGPGWRWGQGWGAVNGVRSLDLWRWASLAPGWPLPAAALAAPPRRARFPCRLRVVVGY